jgi:hypothetical protein
MISANKLNEIGERYGEYSSWAIWNPDDIRDTSLIEQNRQELRTDIVMVGLNVSKDISVLGSWANFHAGPNDRWLRFAFNDSRFRGAYLTDILKGEIDVSSSNVMAGIRAGLIDIDQHIVQFRHEMSDVGANVETLFVVFGKGAQSLFGSYLQALYPKIVFCEHFASTHRAKATWRSETLTALESY